MRFVDALRMAFAQLRSQRLKSAFMAVGVTIAVAFLIALVSIMHGLRKQMEDEMAEYLQSQSFMVYAGRHESWSDMQANMNAKPAPITEADGAAIGEALPPGAHWGGLTYGQSTITTVDGKTLSAALYGARGDYFTVGFAKILYGRPFSTLDDALGLRVVALDSATASLIFPGLDPLGRTMSIGGIPYRVVGILTPSPWVGKMSYAGASQYVSVIIPLRSAIGQAMGNHGELYELQISVARPEDMAIAKDRTREVLRVRRRLGPRDPDDFNMYSNADGIQWMEKQLQQVTLMGIVLPLVGILVGALVITNIMLVAVAERIREIGVRKALGARRRDVLIQFLVECTALSSGGAVVGVALGLAGAAIVSHFNAKFPAAVAPWSIGLGIALGITVGIVAGLYPAMRAARLDPIRALRNEA